MKLKLSAVLLAFAFTACSKGGGSSPVVEAGSNVKMHYTLTVDGKVADTSEGKDPLAFTQGAGQIIPGLDREMLGLKVGDKKTVTVAAKDGYGEINPQAIQKMPADMVGKIPNLKVGMMLQGKTPEGQMFRARVIKIDKKEVTVDLNHPLAGKTLTFNVEIVEVVAGKA
ncbi:MAG: peptidylprolyl isomerase [Elusimicrobia bacterium]|nr:MAG: peptidylprolyl isomerase [Elusimicrobiota bacterium]